MANFTLALPSAVQQWSNEYQTEYTRESAFMPYMGKADNSIIRVNMDLSKKSGEYLHFPYFKRLTGAGVTNGNTLFGSEDTLSNYSTAVRVSLFRNAVGVGEDQSFRTQLDIANVARGSLKNWSAEKLRADLLTAAGNIVIPGGTASDGTPAEDTYVSYGSASAGQRNTHLTNNSDRTLYGNAKANAVSGVHATALGTIAAGQTMSASVLNLARIMARTTSAFKINPYRSDATAGREWFVLFVGPEGFRDLMNDATIAAANQYARERGVEDNPLFQSGDLIWNGVIIREVPEIASLGAVGASSATVSPAYLCGSGALAVGYAKIAEPRVQDFDYGHQHNVGIVEIRGQTKMSAAGVQTGMVTLYHAAA